MKLLRSLGLCTLLGVTACSSSSGNNNDSVRDRAGEAGKAAHGLDAAADAQGGDEADAHAREGHADAAAPDAGEPKVDGSIISASSARLTGLAVSHGVLEPSFHPDVTHYRVCVGLLTNSISVITTMATGVTAAVNATVASPSVQVELNTGSNTVDVTTTGAPGIHPTTYSIVVERGESQTLTSPTPRTDEQFGYSIAVSDRYLVVGAPGNASEAGAVYVFPRIGFVRNGAGWGYPKRLQGAVSAVGDRFGESVGIYGTNIVVGSPHPDPTGIGTVYVFELIGDDWKGSELPAPAWKPRDADFGRAVAISQNAIAVGKPGAHSVPTKGDVYLYGRAPTGWAVHAEAANPDSHDGDQYGASVALSDDMLVVGAPRLPLSASAGAVYVFGQHGGVFTHPAPHTLRNAAGQADGFGRSVAVFGDKVAVGAPRETKPTTGAVHIYIGDAVRGLSEQAVVKPSQPHAETYFGSYVALNATTLLVGSAYEAQSGSIGRTVDPTSTVSGAYVYAADGTSWIEKGHIHSPSRKHKGFFGTPVAIMGTAVVIGSSQETATSVGSPGVDFTKAGVVYAFF